MPKLLVLDGARFRDAKPGDVLVNGDEQPVGGGGSGDMTRAVYDANQDGKVAAADAADVVPWGGVTGKPGTYPPSAHSHPQDDVTGLVAGLAGKAAASHTHAEGDITGLVADLAGKAASSHQHSAGDVTSGTVATARLGSGTADSSTFLRGDQSWAAPSGGAGPVSTAKQSGAVTNSSNTTPSSVPGLAFAVVVGRRYLFQFYLTYRTAATTTGIAFVFTAPAMTAANWMVTIRQAAAGTDMLYTNSATALTTVLVSASVVAANTDYLVTIEGFCDPSASGTVQLQVRSEVNGSLVTVQNTGVGMLVDAG